MSRTMPSRPSLRRTRSVAAAVVVTAVVVPVALRHGSPLTPSATAIPAITAAPALRPPGSASHEHRGEPSVADGVVPDGTTVFDAVPAVTRLDPALLTSLRRAAREAAEDHVEFDLNSGWRSPAYQEHLLEAAIAKYGSREEAARWVATPARSAHVAGEAVDLGHDAATWLSEHGAAYGLCRVYANEPWHYELRPDAVHDGCPDLYADPTHDPRM